MAQAKSLKTPEGVPSDADTIPFTVDSALLRELGERLVGQPHIALAELVKNAYDADAKNVIIRIDPARGEIHVIDDGHGMSEREFRRFWMRIGSPHKQEEKTSRELHRSLTGSKGVGRLSVQFLGKGVRIRTRTKNRKELDAFVDWKDAVEAGQLTEAIAWKWTEDRPDPELSIQGTKITITNLDHSWSSSDIEDLAQEIWWLQPPFRSETFDDSSAMTIKFQSPDSELVSTFEDRMRDIFRIHHASVFGEFELKDRKKRRGKLRIKIEFSDGEVFRENLPFDDCDLNSANFRILVYHIQHRQKYGIKVEQARDYLEKFGGVHVYDAGFRLPYYGLRDADWLGIEYDHSKRIRNSRLLPEKLNFGRGMQYLPTIRRLIGIVHVNTARERILAPRKKKESLQIQITRDRLIPNKAYNNLVKIVRSALDYYATREAIRKFRESNQKPQKEPSPTKIRKIEEILDESSDEIPPKVYASILKNTKEALQAAEEEEESLKTNVGLLGSLATAGMAALAYEHEFARHFQELEEIASLLESRKDKSAKTTAKKIRAWIEKVRNIRKMFSHLTYSDNRDIKTRLKAGPVLEQVIEQVRGFIQTVNVTISDIPTDLRLPTGTFMEWSAIFQNVLINARNALLDSSEREIKISFSQNRKSRIIRVEDNGHGVDLKKAERLFQPFFRQTKISKDRQGLGLGGTGLGLTIVRMIANELGCSVRFSEPSEKMSTAFEIYWKEN